MKNPIFLFIICISNALNAQEITIPVVVHIVYATEEANISDAQIYSQIEALNRDYRANNSDTALIPESLRDSITDTNISFVLASVNPSGEATNGITRTETDVIHWEVLVGSGSPNYIENIKSTENGGIDPWDTKCYLNIWVGDLGASVLSSAQPPGGDLLTDGVVVGYIAFGVGLSTLEPYDNGRSAVHAVGHWLDLMHVNSVDAFEACWGDDPEPEAEDYNIMNLLDDKCSLMFFEFQKAIMQNVLATSRSEIGTCNWATAIAEKETTQIKLYPNPATDFIFYMGDAISADYKIINIAGEIVAFGKLESANERIDLYTLSAGLYCLILFNENEVLGSYNFMKQ